MFWGRDVWKGSRGLHSWRRAGPEVGQVPCRRSQVLHLPGVLLVEVFVLVLVSDLLEDRRCDLPCFSYVVVDPSGWWVLEAALPTQVVDPWACQAYQVSVSIARHLHQLV